MTITTIEVKSLGKTHVSITPDQVISETGENRNVVELDNETILFAAEQIKEKVGGKDILSRIKAELKERIKNYEPFYSSVDGTTRLAEAESFLEFVEGLSHE